MTTLTRKEVANLLDISPNTVRGLAQKKKIKRLGENMFDEDSVLAYIKARNLVSRAVGKANGGRVGTGKSKQTQEHRDKRLNDIYWAIVDLWTENGRCPVFVELAPRVKMAKSGLSRYLPELEKQGKIEVVGPGKQIMLKGMVEHLKQWTKETYAQKAIS